MCYLFIFYLSLFVCLFVCIQLLISVRIQVCLENRKNRREVIYSMYVDVDVDVDAHQLSDCLNRTASM